MSRGGCVSSDEDCLPPRAPTGADVSFFSTLGCSLRAALTSGSMALALLSPFIWSERALAPVPVCRWPFFHLASSLSLSSPDSWLPQPAADRRQVLGLHKHAHPPQTHTHTHISVASGYDASGSGSAMCPHFFFFGSHTPPRFSTPFHPSVSAALTFCLGFFSFLHQSLESGRSRSSIWRGTSCGPERLQRHLPPAIQHLEQLLFWFSWYIRKHKCVIL